MAKRPRPAEAQTPALPFESGRISTLGYAIWWYPQGSSAKLSEGARAHVSLIRQGRVIQRNFHELNLGGAQAVLLIATAYRDAIMRLLPPQTQRQRSSTPNRRLTASGIPGVIRTENRGSAYWIGMFCPGGKKRSKTFSVKRYGEAQAKAMAIEARANLLREHPDYFMTANADATEVAQANLAHCLQQETVPVLEPIEVMSPERIEHLLGLVNGWFDRVRPAWVRVSAQVYAGKRPILRLVVAVRDEPGQSMVKTFRLGANRSVEQARQLAWMEVQSKLTHWIGVDGWEAFAGRYQKAFAELRAEEGFRARFCPGDLIAEPLRRPPAELADLLPAFEIPRLSYANPGGGIETA